MVISPGMPPDTSRGKRVRPACRGGQCLTFKMNNMKIQVKTGFGSLKASDLIAKCKSVEDKMNDNPLFASPVPAIADVTAARSLLEEHFQAARFGDREAIARRRTQEAVVADLLRRLAAYVKALAQKPEDVLSAGFETVQRNSAPLTVLARPAGLEALRANAQGEVELKWTRVRGGMQYLIEMTLTDPAHPDTVWEVTGYSSRTRHAVTQLNPGTYYWFRVSALGRVGKSAYSDPAVVMAA